MSQQIRQPKEIRAIGIGRVSLEIQADNYSLDSQRHKFTALEEKFGCQIPADLMIEDEGYSGTNFNRPALQKALRWIREGKANAVAFPYVDRFARNLEGGLNMIRQFRELGADVLLGDLGFVKDEQAFKLMMQFHLMIAEMQRDQIQERSQAGVMAKLRRGLVHCGRAPYGWLFMSKARLQAAGEYKGGRPQNRLDPVQAELDTVKLIGRLILDGHSAKGTARELQARGIKAPRASQWNSVTVKKFVYEPLYSTGLWYYGKRVAAKPDYHRRFNPDRHREKTTTRPRPQSQWSAPIQLKGAPWTPAEQERIQDALKRNGGLSRGRIPGVTGFNAMLKSLVVCRECGKAVSPKTMRRTYHYYGCTYRDRITGEHLCSQRSVKAEALESAVWQAWGEALGEKLDDLLKPREDAIKGQADDHQELLKLKAQQARLIRKRTEAMELQVEADDVADKRVYAAKAAEIKVQLVDLARRIQNLASVAEPVAIDRLTVKAAVKLGMKTTDPQERRAIITDWVERVKYADHKAVITFRLPLADAKGKQPEHDVCPVQHR
jgi:site-specific DNA recombinase